MLVAAQKFLDMQRFRWKKKNDLSLDYWSPLNRHPPLMKMFIIIAPAPLPQPSRHLLFLLFAQPPCQVEVESDPAKRTSDDSSSEN